MVEQVYRARQPKASPLWQCLSRHFDAFLEGYEERYQSRYGFLRPIIPQVVNIPQPRDDCGDLEQGFARVRCDHCKHEYLLPEVSLKPLEELFRARVITFLLDKGLLPPERARMLRGWVHSGFNRNAHGKCASSRS